MYERIFRLFVYKQHIVLGLRAGPLPTRGQCLLYCCRLQQPVQNPISDNTNVLWNSPSLGKNYSYRLPLVL